MTMTGLANRCDAGKTTLKVQFFERRKERGLPPSAVKRARRAFEMDCPGKTELPLPGLSALVTLPHEAG